MNEDAFRPVGRKVIVVLAVTIGALAISAIILWIRYLEEVSATQPLSITACTVDSYDVPDENEQGPPQSSCDKPYSGPIGSLEDTVPIDGKIVVAGQVCNMSDQAISYNVQISWARILSDTRGLPVRFPVIDIPIVYETGCNPPYQFTFPVPRQLVSAVEESGVDGYGQWKIVGLASPTSRRFDPYQWDVTRTFTLVD